MSKWQQTTVGEFLSLQRGYDLTEDEREPGDVPVMGAAGHNGFHSKAIASAPGIIVGRCGGSFGQIHFAKADFWPHNTAMFVTDFKGSDPYFTFYFLKNIDFSKLNSGSAQPSLNRNYVYPMRITVPSPEEQKRIAAILSALDAKIDCNNRINTELEAMAKTLYDYWFVQFDFPDVNGKPYKSSGGNMVYNATLKRDIPDGWEDKQLSHIANITMGTSPTGDSLNNAGDGIEFFQGSTDFGWRFPTVRQYTTQAVRMAKRGDILLSVRAPVGDLNIAHIDCSIGRGLAALNSRAGFDGFLFYVMQYFKTIFDRRNSEGTTFGSITKDDLHSLPLAYPTADLLKKYNGIVLGFNQMVFSRSMENQQLSQLRDWLLPLLMNGQVRADMS